MKTIVFFTVFLIIGSCYKPINYHKKASKRVSELTVNILKKQNSVLLNTLKELESAKLEVETMKEVAVIVPDPEPEPQEKPVFDIIEKVVIPTVKSVNAEIRKEKEFCPECKCSKNSHEIDDNMSYTICRTRDYLALKKKLFVLYEVILKEYEDCPEFIKKLKRSQKAWIVHRDAEIDAMFPQKGNYGSSESLCWVENLIELTQLRIKRLQFWKDGHKEGEICFPSVKVKGEKPYEIEY